MYIILLNFAQNSMLKMSSIMLYLHYKHLKAKFKGVATVTYCATKMIST